LNNDEKIYSLVEDIKNDIINSVKVFPLYIGFSGGMDSTALAYLCIDALGKENVRLVHVIYGPYSYSKGLENCLRTASNLDCELELIDKRCTQEKVLSHGPSCNRCTKQVKIDGVKSAIKNTGELVLTGANKSDSWGEYGFKIMNGVYAPLLELDKVAIDKILDYYHVEREHVKIGESLLREGCKAKHLLKMLIVPHYHGHSVSLSNEIILDILEQASFKAALANVKIVGPLNSNIALINIKPLPERHVVEEIVRRISAIHSIDKVLLVERPLRLKISANPSIYRNPQARERITEGFLSREFAAPILCDWHETSNSRLNTFHVVEVKQIKE